MIKTLISVIVFILFLPLFALFLIVGISCSYFTHMRNAYYKAAEEVIEFLNNEITEQNKQIQMLVNEEQKTKKSTTKKSGD